MGACGSTHDAEEEKMPKYLFQAIENAAGGATVKTTVLLTPEQVDEAANRAVSYRPPGL